MLGRCTGTIRERGCRMLASGMTNKPVQIDTWDDNLSKKRQIEMNW